MYSCKWLVAALLACALASACNDFNTNLSTQTSSSAVAFVSPSTATIGNVPPTGLPITVTGTGFVSTGIYVLWNAGTANQVQLTNTVYVSPTLVTATVPAADITNTGTSPISVPIAVQIPGSAVSGASNVYATNTTEVSNVVLFTVNPVAAPAPTIASLSPSNIGAGSGAFTLTVTGTNFVNSANTGSVIYWNGVAVTPTTVTGTTTASATIPASDVASIGTAKVSISNSASGGVSSSPATFTITSAAPTPSVRTAGATPSSVLASSGVSSDRRFVVFSMASTDGITETPGSTENIFVRDTCTGAATGCVPSTTLDSIGVDGQASDGDSSSPSISADGRYVAFVSLATDLVSGDTNNVADVFVRDTCTGASSGCTPTTQRVSVATDGTQANDASVLASISATGRYVTFSSTATNLDPASSTGSSGFSAIFLRDTCAGAPAGCTPSTQQLNLQN